MVVDVTSVVVVVLVFVLIVDRSVVPGVSLDG